MDDLISRQVAIEEFKKELTEGESHGNYVTICSALGFEGIRHILERLPSTQRTGKWVELPPTRPWKYICDQCGSRSDFKYNYCPDCGAKME